MIGEVRKRNMPKVEETMKGGMFRLETVVSDSVLKLRLLPSKMKVLVLLSAILSFMFYMYVAHWVFASNSEKALESLLDTEKCPACFGGSACGLFYHKQLHLSGSSKFRILDMINAKNVHFAVDRDGKSFVVKKLATDSELRALDERLCKDAMRPEGCDIARVFIRTNMAMSLMHEPLTPKKLKEAGGFMFRCPSYRLLDRLWTYYKEYKKKNEIFLSDKSQVLYMALLNPEPLLLQTFPQSEGWPFPHYIGACGRTVVEEYKGVLQLSDFFHSSFQIRAGLAYELMLIAETLTSKSDFALYITDVSYENFVVDDSLKVTLIDVENIVVVDKMALEARKPSGYSDPHESLFSDCKGENCLDFSIEDLCTHVHSDHNYNAICRNLLSHYANEPGMQGGLLHDMPEEAEDYWDLKNLLEECARPTQKMGRWKVKDLLLQALKALKDETKDHLKKKSDNSL